MNFTIDLSSLAVIAYIVATTANTLISSTLDFLDLEKGNLKVRLEDLHRRFPVSRKLLTLGRLRKAISYNAESSRFGDIVSTFRGAATTMLLLFGILPMFLKLLVVDLGFNPYLTVSTAVLVWSVLSTAFDIPFSLYGTFVLEERNGFNRMDGRTFARDTLKEFLTGTILSLATANLLQFAFSNLTFTSCNAILLVLGFNLLTFAISLFAFPLMKVFNRFEPLKDRSLERSLSNLFHKSGLNPPEVYVMDSSKRTSHSNAFVFRGFRRMRIVLFDNLFKDHPKDEILAIVAHEIGHVRHRHILKNRILSFLSTSLVTLLSVSLMYDLGFLHAFGFRWITPQNLQTYSLVGFALSQTFLAPFLSLVANPISNAISRRFEYEADSFSGTLMRSPKPLQNALLRISSRNLSDPFPLKALEFLTYDHPSLGNRLENLQNKRNSKSHNPQNHHGTRTTENSNRKPKTNTKPTKTTRKSRKTRN